MADFIVTSQSEQIKFIYDASKKQVELIQELKNHLSTMELTKDQYEDLLNRINRKIIISKSQLRKETVKIEKNEAFGMDFTGKIHVIENAITTKSLIELTYDSSEFPEGENIILCTPLMLTRESTDTFVDVLIEPEKTQELINKMEEYFKSINCEYVLVDVFAYNENAFNFYSKKDYHPRMHTMIKKIKE